jgi:signal transduction histidine kinase
VSGTLSDAADELTLTVDDDGIGGVDPAKGTGLIGLVDRTEARGGTITVTSAPTGTRVIARIPVGPH